MTSLHRFSQFVRFCSAGGVGVLLYYSILYTATELVGKWYMVSAVMASVVNWTANFVLQKVWTFKNKETKDIFKQAFSYAKMAVMLSAANLVLLYALVEFMGFWYLAAQAVVTVILTLVSYFVTKGIFIPARRSDG